MAPTRWVYVTGCDSGFGSVVVKDLAARDFGVFATHINDASAKILSDAHPNIVPLKVDITVQKPVDDAAVEIKKKLDSIPNAVLWGLVNNAGLLLQSGPAEWTPASNLEKMLQVNVVGASRVVNSVLPLLRRSQGRIVNVASIAGRIGLPTQSAYCASKHAIEGYSDCLRRELLDFGVHVIIIEPGVFNKTNLYSTYSDGVQKLWEGLSPAVQADYGEKFRDGVQELANKGLNRYGSPDNSLVPKAMVEALTCKRPRYRYQVGPDAKFLVPYFKWFHEYWQDTIFTMEKSAPAATMVPGVVAQYRTASWYKKLFFLYILFKLFRAVRKM